jgi:hypothetical protein
MEGGEPAQGDEDNGGGSGCRVERACKESVHPAGAARQLKGDGWLFSRNRPQSGGEICDALPERLAIGAAREMCLEEQVFELGEFGVHAQR